MGVVYPGIPKKIVLKIIELISINTFVETGTYHGATALWASVNFPRVITIENSIELWENVHNKYIDKGNINFLLGDSRSLLKTLMEEATPPTLFWLDAHWSGGSTYGENDECAIIEELNAINEYSGEKVILIDDARLFLSPPPHPYNHKYWPTISEVFRAINSNKQYSAKLKNDVIISVPKSIENEMINTFKMRQLWSGNYLYMKKVLPEIQPYLMN